MEENTLTSSCVPPVPPPPPPQLPSFLAVQSSGDETNVQSAVLMNGNSASEASMDGLAPGDHVANESAELQSPTLTYLESTEGLIVDSDSTGSPKMKTDQSSKPSRLQKAFSAHSLTLPSLRKSLKASKSRKTDGRNSITSLSEKSTDGPETSAKQNGDGNLRDASLWRLPGINTLKKKKVESSGRTKPTVPPKPTDVVQQLSPHTRMPVDEQDSTSLISVSSGKRELPPIPTLQSTTCIAGNTMAASDVSSALSSEENISDHADGDRVSKSNPKISPAPSATSLGLSPSPINYVDHMPTTLCVNQMLKVYSQHCPLRFRVLQGYCSETSDVNLSTGDIHDLHSVKQTNAVTIRDEDGITYHIPVDSQMKFGLIFNLSSNCDEGLSGYDFKTISEITSLSVLPKVICATNAVDSNDAKVRVEKNEVFVVCQVQRSMFKGKKGLKVFSLLSKSAKVLPEDCAGAFSTNPSLVRMHLLDILDYVTNPFPSLAVMYPMSNNPQLFTSQDFPGSQSGVVTLMEHSKESALVVSAVVDPEQEIIPADNSSTFDIPLNDEILELEVVILKHTQPESVICSDNDMTTESEDKDDDHVYDDTLSVIEKSDPSVALQLSSSMSQSMPDTLNIEMQPGISSSPRLDNRVNNGPEYVNLPYHQPEEWYEKEENDMSNSDYKYTDEEAGYDTVGLHLIQNETLGNSVVSSSYDKIDGRRNNSEPQLNDSLIGDLHSTTRALEKRLNTIEDSQQSSEMNRMQTMLEQLTKKLESVDSQLHTIAMSPPTAASNTVTGAHDNHDKCTGVTAASNELTSEDTNKKYLCSLSVEQICELLDAMDLGQYKEKFLKEQMSGEILIECDESVLQAELGITSKIHRIRLMKLLTGQHSAASILLKHQSKHTL